MGLKLFKRREVPEELPDLATDKLEKTGIEKDKEIVNSYLREKEAEKAKPETPAEKAVETENSFFNRLQGDLNNELTSLNKLEKWYSSKFLPQDAVEGMKGYWEKQKESSVIKIIGKDFKEKINEKTEKLQKLEKEWQGTYFQMLEKEEEIRKEEQELKKVLAEFVGLCKSTKKKRK